MRIKNFDEFDLNEKKEDHKHEYGCVMAYFKFPEMEEVQSLLDENDIYVDENDSSYGVETKHHVTLLYGLLEEVTDDKVFDICMKHEIGEIKLSNASAFESEKYDVLKFDASNDELHVINKELDKLPNENSFPEYHPHCTIAYLKKETVQKYIDLLKDKEYVVEANSIIYSKPDGEEIKRKL
jgi:2'-5' RNA ligase